ncbi:hypothetical protein [Actinoplanes sp. NPDC051411]|uniref:hypothetical protein n=1 Tax=Actinoplanes sp. NPDC051411 TaxID=3155522 RepID=UPI00341758BB
MIRLTRTPSGWTVMVMSVLLSRIVVAIALLGTSMAPAAKEARAPHFTASSKPAGGLPGSEVQVAFAYEPPVINYRPADTPAAITSCEFYLDADQKSTAGCGGAAGDTTWTMAMPKSLKAGKHDVHWTIRYTLYNKPQSDPDTGAFTFEVVEPAFSAVAEPAAAHPGQPVDVRFTGEPAGLTITGCSVQGVKCGEDGGGWFARIPAPDTTSVVPWNVAYTGGPGTDDIAPGEVEIKVEPWPAPEFQVGIAGSARVAPGTPVTVQFASLTTGVDVKTCSVTYRRERTDCTGTDLATVTIPGDAGTGPVELPWELTFESSRRGEKSDRRTGSVGVTVVVEEPDFSVTVQPPSARPGDTVTLTFTSLIPGVEIVDCLAFFPHAIGNTCRRSPQRRVVRTRVPTDQPPGATLLRWGVESTDAAGRRGVDNDVIPYLILPPLLRPPLPQTGASTRATTPTSGGGPGTGTKQVATMPGPAPEFVAETRPETAAPGARVTVVVSPLDPDVRMLGCAVAFSGGGDHACRHSGDRWSAQTTVPAGAPAGETLPLAWRVSFVDPAGSRAEADGTTDYPVHGSAPAAPAFEVVADPAAAAGGKEVTVSHNSEDTGVTITGCRVGFTDNTLTSCRQSPGGWTAQVEVPPAMSAGPAPLHWTIAYARSGGAGGTAQGLSSFLVLPLDNKHDWRDTAWSLLWRTALGGVLLVGLLALRVIRKPILDRFRPHPAAVQTDERRASDDQPREETVFVVPVAAPEEMSVRVDRPDAPPARDIRLQIRRPRLVPHVPEDLP